MLLGKRYVRVSAGHLKAGIVLVPTTKNAPFMYEYRFSVGWEAVHFCQPGDDVNSLLEIVKDELREAVYSGFRTRLRDLEIAFLEHDRNAMLSAIRDLRREVFG